MDTGHQSEAQEEESVSGAELSWIERLRLETVFTLMLPCHGSPGHNNDEPSWGHTQHSSLSPSPVEIWASPWL